MIVVAKGSPVGYVPLLEENEYQEGIDGGVCSISTIIATGQKNVSLEGPLLRIRLCLGADEWQHRLRDEYMED
jgi:hypothetical protein